jgi:hypothetical protein
MTPHRHVLAGRSSCAICGISKSQIKKRQVIRHAIAQGAAERDRLRTALITLGKLEGIVFACDDKERPMLAQTVVRHIVERALSDEDPAA